MYLLVIVTLIVGLLGVYAQIVALQAARYASSLSGLGKTMVLWHGAAVSMGAKVVATPGATFPCSLTIGVPTVAAGYLQNANLAAPGTCKAPAGGAATSGTVTDAVGSDSATIDAAGDKVHLPPGYDTVQHQFFSILYQDGAGGQYYVVTFVPAPIASATNPAPGYIALAPLPPAVPNLISFTSNDLMHQLSLVGIPDYAYGEVSANGKTLVSKGVQTGTACVTTPAVACITYNMPLVGGLAVLKANSVAIVSSTAGF